MRSIALLSMTLWFCSYSDGQSLEETTRDGWLSHAGENFSIQYPPHWKLDDSGKRQTLFIIEPAEAPSDDPFVENVNLSTQDLAEHVDLDQFVTTSERQIINEFTSGRVLLSERTDWQGRPCHFLAYSGLFRGKIVRLDSYIWILDNTAYILTLMGKYHEFEKFEKIGNEIMGTFLLE